MGAEAGADIKDDGAIRLPQAVGFCPQAVDKDVVFRVGPVEAVQCGEIGLWERPFDGHRVTVFRPLPGDPPFVDDRRVINPLLGDIGAAG